MTFAGPASRAIPINPSSNPAPRRDHHGLRCAAAPEASLTGRSTTLVGRWIVISSLWSAWVRCQDDAVTQARPYAGVDAAERLAGRRARLLEAGLELMGRDVMPAELTVRGVCQEAGVATRYFYESFPDKDEFVGAVFDWVIAQLAATTQAAVAAALPGERNRAGLANIVRSIEQDPRIGRLMFGNQVANAAVIRKRRESESFFAMLSGEHVGSVLQRAANARIQAVSHFVVGGVTQTISSWLAGGVGLDAEELVDQLSGMVNAFGQPQLFRD